MINYHYRTLVQNLKLVASPVNIQVGVLPVFVVVADEVALGFYDAYLLSPELLEEEKISEITFELIVKLNQYFDIMSKDKSLWTVEQMKNNEEWEKTRRMAMVILESMGEQYMPPEIGSV